MDGLLLAHHTRSNTSSGWRIARSTEDERAELVRLRRENGTSHPRTRHVGERGRHRLRMHGSTAVAVGASKTVTVPARNSCAVQELPRDAGLLSPGFVWGTPTWSPGPLTTVPANGSVTLTVTNPTVPIFGRVSVTKAITGAVDGVTADAQFAIRVACDNGYDNTFTVGVGGTGTTTDLPVGTTCVVTEASPTGGLVDPSYAWGAVSIPDQPVRIDSSGQVVPVTVANDVVRVTGQVSITKAPITPAGIVDPARTFDIGYVCSYGGDIQTQGTATVAQNLTALTPAV